MNERDLSGTTIAGRYRVIRRIGGGGMGTVWLVRHVESHATYALKTLNAQVADDRMAVERFLREARAAASLRSRHVVKVVDAQMVNVDERTKLPNPFIVMELLEGANLEQLFAHKTPLDPEELVWVLKQVGRALDVAHQQGIVHRDLKPENIFVALDEEGEPITKVCDFGIAKLASDTSLMPTGALGTQTGVTIGTPMYMSPEQARSSTDVTPASDQWAIGLVAFRALTGREYFGEARTTTELLLKIVNDPMEAPSRRLSTLPSEFDTWFYRSCARDAQARWPSVGEQITALATALAVTTPRPPVLPPINSTIAMAATISATPARPQPDTAVQVTTAAPSARTQDATVVRARPVPWFFALLALAGLAAIGVGAFLLRTPSPPPAAASAAVAPSPAPTTHAPLVPPLPSTPSTEPPPAASTVVVAPTVPATGKGFPKTKPTPSVAVATVAPSAAASATAPAKPTSSKLPKGAACVRSNECASGFCVAEECQ